jgi:O-antigen/teichoic acid export membrane protein
MTPLTRIIDNIIALFVRQLLTWTLTAILIVFLPRYLGDVGLGKVTFAISLTTMLLVLTNMGTATFTVKTVALDRGRLSELLWNAYAIRLLSGIAIAGSVVAVTRFMGLDGEAAGVIYLVSGMMVVSALDKAQVAAIQGLEEMRWPAMAEVLNKATVMSLGIFLLVKGHGPAAYAFALLAGTTVSFLFNGLYVARRHLSRPRISLSASKTLLIGGFPFFLTGALGQIYMWQDAVILRLITRDAVVGWYGAAVQLFATVNVVPLVIVTAILPALTRFHAQDKETMRIAAQRCVQAVLVTGVPLALALMLVSGDIIHFLHYPSEFSHSIPLLSLLAFNVPVTGTLMLVGTIVIAADRQKQWAMTMLITTVLALAVNPWLIFMSERVFQNGAVGAAITSIVAEAFTIGIGLRLLPPQVLDKSSILILVRSLIASLVMVGVMGAVKALLDPGLIPLVLIGGPTYVVSLLAVGGVTLRELKLLLLIASKQETALTGQLVDKSSASYVAAPLGGEGT